jgi:hypothetical protein
MDSTWIPHELHMDSTLTPHGLHMDSTWTLQKQTFFYLKIMNHLLTNTINIYTIIHFSWDKKSVTLVFYIPPSFPIIIYLFFLSFIIVININLMRCLLLFLLLNYMLSMIEQHSMQEPVKISCFHTFKN